jgi:hypothetical protein
MCNERGDTLDDLNFVLKETYKFYQYSPKRIRQVQQVAEALLSNIQKFHYLHKMKDGLPEKLVLPLQCEGFIILLYTYKVLLQKKIMLLLLA